MWRRPCPTTVLGIVSTELHFIAVIRLCIVFMIANEPAERRREAGEAQHYRAVRKYYAGGKNLE